MIVWQVPGGNEASVTISNILSVIFAAGLAFLGYRLYMENRDTLFGLEERQRGPALRGHGADRDHARRHQPDVGRELARRRRVAALMSAGHLRDLHRLARVPDVLSRRLGARRTPLRRRQCRPPRALGTPPAHSRNTRVWFRSACADEAGGMPSSRLQRGQAAVELVAVLPFVAARARGRLAARARGPRRLGGAGRRACRRARGGGGRRPARGRPPPSPAPPRARAEGPRAATAGASTSRVRIPVGPPGARARAAPGASAQLRAAGGPMSRAAAARPGDRRARRPPAAARGRRPRRADRRRRPGRARAGRPGRRGRRRRAPPGRATPRTPPAPPSRPPRTAGPRSPSAATASRSPSARASRSSPAASQAR